METQHLRLCLAFLMAILIIPGTAQAIQLGSVIKSNYINLNPGERAEFRILVWTTENETFPIVFYSLNAPEGYDVVIYPNEFELNMNPEGEVETMLLPGKEIPINARIVSVFVDTPMIVDQPSKNLIIKALAGGNKENISVLQERTFSLTLDFVNNVEDENQDSIQRFLGDVYKGLTGFFLNESVGNSWFSIILIIIIICISWRIYKYE